jgi:hypothetical protein
VAEPVFANIRTQKRLDHPQREAESKYPVVIVLQGAQYREDRKLWLHLSENTAKMTPNGEMNRKKKRIDCNAPLKSRHV